MWILLYDIMENLNQRTSMLQFYGLDASTVVYTGTRHQCARIALLFPREARTRQRTLKDKLIESSYFITLLSDRKRESEKVGASHVKKHLVKMLSSTARIYVWIYFSYISGSSGGGGASVLAERKVLKTPQDMWSDYNACCIYFFSLGTVCIEKPGVSRPVSFDC